MSKSTMARIRELEAKVGRYRGAIEQASFNFNRDTKYGKGWHDALAYVNQAVKPTEKDDE